MISFETSGSARDRVVNNNVVVLRRTLVINFITIRSINAFFLETGFTSVILYKLLFGCFLQFSTIERFNPILVKELSKYCTDCFSRTFTE